jgi:hypothetical protein
MKDGPQLRRPAAPGGEPTPRDVRRGRWAAIILFVVCAVLQVAITGAARAAGRSEEQLNVLFFDLFLALLGPLAAAIIHFNLPRQSRGAYWSAGALCLFLTLLLWGVTCGMM